jgi:anaphase-promoting complex subunit 2
MLKFIDPTSYILDGVSEPIKIYLRQRKDTMRCIITTVLSEEDESLKEDLSKQYVKSNYPLLIQNKENEYDYLSSDEDERAAENWHPLPLDNNNIQSTKSRISDIISTLVNIFGSPEKFIEQYKKMLAERSISDPNFSIENEIKNIELLKIKFGETLLQGCDVIIKDVNESLKINNSIKSIKLTDEIRTLSYSQSFELNCLIINKNFWPFKETQSFNLNPESEDLHSYSGHSPNRYRNSPCDVFLENASSKFETHKNKYKIIKPCRTLCFLNDVGYVDISLTFQNGSFNFRVLPLSALVINFFDESNQDQFENFTLEYISEKLGCSIQDAKKRINFWISKGVLNEGQKKEYGHEENKSFYYPATVLSNVEILNNSGDLIIEEEIYKFEFEENEIKVNLENAISSIIKNAGPRNFEQLFKNLIISYQVQITEIKLKEILGKMILDQKLFKEGELYKIIVINN